MKYIIRPKRVSNVTNECGNRCSGNCFAKCNSLGGLCPFKSN